MISEGIGDFCYKNWYFHKDIEISLNKTFWNQSENVIESVTLSLKKIPQWFKINPKKSIN